MSLIWMGVGLLPGSGRLRRRPVGASGQAHAGRLGAMQAEVFRGRNIKWPGHQLERVHADEVMYVEVGLSPPGADRPNPAERLPAAFCKTAGI